MFERIISKGRRLEDLIQKKLDDLKENHKFRGGLLGINLHKSLILPREQIKHDDEIVLARVRDFYSGDDHRGYSGSKPIRYEEFIEHDSKKSRTTRKVRKALLASSAGLNELNLYLPWNLSAHPIGIEEAYKITWPEFKKLLIKKYCPRTEVKKMEDEFYSLAVKGNDLKTYIRRFQELAVLCPTMVPNSKKLMEVFIGGLPRSIKGNVTASKPQTLEEAITITQRLMDQVIKHNSVQGTNDHKRKFDDRRTFTNNNYQNNRNNNSNNDHQQQQNRRHETVRAYAVTPTKNSRYTGSLPQCKKFTLHHIGHCTVKCQNCNKVGHLTRNCRNKAPATGSNLQPVSITCHACEEKGHYKSQCSSTNNNFYGREYLLRDKNAHQDPNVVTGMFLLNQHLARVLFNSGADKSFVSISLASMLYIPPIILDTTYDIEMANGNLVDKDYHQTESQGMKDIPKSASERDLMNRISHSEFSGHVIDSQGIHVDPAKIEEVKNWASPTTPTKKNKKYIWGENQESAFQLLKQKLCEAPILALPEGNDDFVVYCDASHQGLGAANVVADALNWKERIKPLRVRALVMPLHPKLPSQILEAQTEAIKEENIKVENLRGMDKAFKVRPDGTRCIKN
ncbi:reverse transcriptase domain-containing protein [Tanacetum coccineum]